MKKQCVQIFAYSFVFFTACYGSYLSQDSLVVVSVPVADCIGISAQKINPSVSAQKLYADLPHSPEKGEYSCARIHQCLFNEVGTLCEQTDDEVLVEFPHFFWLVDGARYSRVWLHKSSVRCLSQAQSRYGIPEPLNHRTGGQPSRDVLTLSAPWHQPGSDKIYSVGTRFVRFSPADCLTSYAILVPDFEKGTCQTLLVPSEHARIEYPANAIDRKKLFVATLKEWVHGVALLIAYTWGGSSYCDRVQSGGFQLESEQRDGKEFACWRRPLSRVPICGFDCSGLILRAAQCAGMEYYCKNTVTIGACLTPVLSEQPLEEGDLILIPRHVMVISDLSKSLLIDAMGYTSGYGCVREVPLSEVFQGIESYDLLREVVQRQQPLSMKDKEGKVFKEVTSVKFMRLADQH